MGVGLGAERGIREDAAPELSDKTATGDTPKSGWSIDGEGVTTIPDDATGAANHCAAVAGVVSDAVSNGVSSGAGGAAGIEVSVIPRIGRATDTGGGDTSEWTDRIGLGVSGILFDRASRRSSSATGMLNHADGGSDDRFDEAFG